MSNRLTREAEERGISDWPNVMQGEDGTQVHLHADFRNADILLIASKPTKVKDVLVEAKRIARLIGQDNADFITWSGTLSSCVDIEMNKNIRHVGRSSIMSIDVSGLRNALLGARALPKPVMLCVDPSDTTDSMLAGSPFSSCRFYSLSSIPTALSVTFDSTIEWYAYPVALLMLCLFALPLYGAGQRLLGAIRKDPANIEEPRIRKTPEEVQAKYDKQKPLRLLLPFALLPIFSLAFFGTGPRNAIPQALALISPNALNLLMPVLFIYMLLMLGLTPLASWIARRRALRAGITLPKQRTANPLGHMWPLFIGLTILISIMLLPIKTFSNPDLRFLLIFCVMAGSWSATAVLSMRARKRNVKLVSQDDALYQRVKSIADLAGVKVRNVEIKDSKVVNAYASLAGNVGLTTGLLDNMTPQEQDTVIAHEIGHLKGGHVRRTFVYSLVLSASLLGVLLGGDHLLEGRVPDNVRQILTGPFLFIPALPILQVLLLGKGRRKREHEADQFAAQITGNPELVAKTLTKLHTLNETPHRLRGLDETLSTHPSLEHRVEAITGGQDSQTPTTGSAV